MPAVIPSGWQQAQSCRARIVYQGRQYVGEDFQATEWRQSAPVLVDEQPVGSIELFHLERAAFFPEEQKLLSTIAEQPAASWGTRSSRWPRVT
jgi:urease accessory protein UreH